MKMKVLQYWKNTSLTFCLVFVLYHKVKLLGIETLLEVINNNMNVVNLNNISIIKSHLEQLFMEYSTQIGRLETPSTPLGPLHPQGGKKKVRSS